MVQQLRIDEIDNLTIAVLDASGNPVSPPVTFDAAPVWTLVDTGTSSGASLVPAADGLTAVLTPGAVGATVTVNLALSVGGTPFTATLDVTTVAGVSTVASIAIVATPAPKPTP